jgi:transposase
MRESLPREIGPEACANIRYVTIDMSHAYRSAIEEHLPYAKIVYDRFHVERLVSAAVDETRREEWRRTRGTEEAKTIKHTRWALLKNDWNLTRTQFATLAPSWPRAGPRSERERALASDRSRRDER